MATPTGPFCVHETLSGTTVDTVTLTGGGLQRVEVINRASAGGADLWVTFARAGSTPATPVAAADDTYWVPPGSVVGFPVHTVGCVVKILGNGNAYSVQGYESSTV